MLNFLIAPDFPPENFSGWHIFNTLLQKRTGLRIRLLTPADSQEESQMYQQNRVDLVYANPFHAAELIRREGYLPVVRPIDCPDEMVIATYADAPFQHSDELPEQSRILVTDNADVRLVGLRLLESAALSEYDIRWEKAATFQAAARRLIAREAEAAFFLSSAYRAFNTSTRERLRILMESRLDDISHVLVVHPDSAAHRRPLCDAFTQMRRDRAGEMVLADLGISQGFEQLDEEDAEFMIDLMDTLRD